MDVPVYSADSIVIPLEQGLRPPGVRPYVAQLYSIVIPLEQGLRHGQHKL